MLTRTEYQFWIDYINDYFPLPTKLVQNMDNWRHRSIVARALARLGQYEPAIALFESMVDVKANVENHCPGLSEIEDKVWCLKELAVIVWHVNGRKNKSTEYLQEALQLITLFPEQFQFLDRHEVWSEIQNFLLFISPTKRKRIH